MDESWFFFDVETKDIGKLNNRLVIDAFCLCKYYLRKKKREVDIWREMQYNGLKEVASAITDNKRLSVICMIADLIMCEILIQEKREVLYGYN